MADDALKDQNGTQSSRSTAQGNSAEQHVLRGVLDLDVLYLMLIMSAPGVGKYLKKHVLRVRDRCQTSYSLRGKLFTRLARIYSVVDILFYSSYSVFFFITVGSCCILALETIAVYSPANTRATLVHCTLVNSCPKCSTDSSIVKNFLVVVMVVHIRDEYQVIVRKMKICPQAAAALSHKMSCRIVAFVLSSCHP